ncbi:MAG: hypothetical protein ACRYFR_11560 [Janthinobacterium lividum]
MKKLLAFSLLLVLATSCGWQGRNGRVTKTGILVLDSSRNHTSFDYFIPCSINDTLTILENMKRAAPGYAINMRQHELDFELMRGSWVVTDDSLFPNDPSGGKHWYVSAVEVAYREEGNGTDKIIKNDSVRLGGILVFTKVCGQLTYPIECSK